MTSTRRTAFTTTVGVIDRVHGNTANVRTLAEPTAATCLTKADIAMVRIRYCTDRGKARTVDEALFT